MMKFIISLTVIFALILEITGYPAVLVPGYPCPSEDINGGCRGPKECLYPHPTNCSRFIQCTAGPSPPGGLAYDMPCALMQDGNRLQWNDNKKECDWPSSSTCQLTTPTRTTTTPSTTTTTTTPSTTTPTPTTTTTTPTTTTTTTTTTPSTTTTTTTPTTTTPGPTVSPCFFCSIADIITTSCRGPKDCLYPNPDDCNSFIQCTVNSDNRTGTPVVMPCPAGLEWNDIDKECDWAPSPTCPNSPITTTTTSTTTTTTTTPTTTTPTTTTPSTTTTTPSTTTPSTTASSISTSFKCPVADIIKTGCKGPTDCMYHDPNSCNNFIHCSVNADNKTGTPHIKACAPSSPPLEWNDLDKRCDWPPSPTC